MDTTYELSDLDKAGFTKSVKVVLFYDLATADSESVVSSFLEGVRNATRYLPFMAGHLQFTKSGKLCIVTSTDSSVDVNICRFTSTECEPFSALAKDSFSPNELDLTRFLPEEPTANHPVCLVQLSLIHGGLVVGFRVNHAAGDWVSLDTFFSLVCQSSKAHEEGRSMPTYTLDGVDLKRVPYNTPAPDPTLSHQDRLAQLPLFHVIQKSQFQFKPPPPTRAGIYRIAEPTIQQLKAQCTPYLDQVEYITSYDCISALIWIALTRARLHLHPDQTNAPSRFVHPINVRSRDPEHKTSPQYFGNAVIGTLAGPIPAHTLIANENRSVAAAASRIRQSIHAVDVSTIGHLTALQASLADSEMLLPNADFADMDLFMNTWYTGSAANYDLGGGTAGPVAFRVQAGMPGACAMILPNLSGGASTKVFEVLVQASVLEYELLETDEQFLKYFEHVV
ncbi:transferase [Aspergillus cavernicola]|uniref:Transferase n=1 Tax=Aspergillus cavernicola TaxID=176166 RepID=A0ABR4HK45_9EURO